MLIKKTVSCFLSRVTKSYTSAFSGSLLQTGLRTRVAKMSNSTEIKTFVTPNGRTVGVSELVSDYKEYARIPRPTQAFLSKKDPLRPLVRDVTVYFESRDVDQTVETTLAKVYRLSLNDEGDVIGIDKSVTHGLDVSSVVSTVVSNDGRMTANLKKKDDKQYIDILVDSVKEKSIAIEDLSDYHGSIITKYPFSHMSWSPDGKKLVYIAEQKDVKTEAFTTFVRKENQKKNKKVSSQESKATDADSKEDKKTSPGQEYSWKEEWGEALEGVVHPVLCVLTVDSEAVSVTDIANYSLLSPVWLKDNSLAFIGIYEDPRKLGLIYCPTRKSVIFAWNCEDDKQPEIIYENKDVSTYVSSLRSDWERSRLVFLERESLAAHFGSSDLVILDLKDRSRRIVIDKNVSHSNDGKRLKGLYCQDLPKVCFTRDDKHVILPVISFDEIFVVSVEAETKKLRILPDTAHTTEILNFDGELLVTSTSKVTERPNLAVRRVFSEKDPILFETTIEEKIIGSCQVVDFVDESTEQEFSAFLVSPSGTEGKKTPCVIIIHGGPHSCFVSNFMSSVALKIRLGFKVVLINYRGGIGVDEKTLNSLLGKIGSQDVQDCMRVIDHFIKKGEIDEKNLVLEGGSHGGFLVTHLSGQHASYDWLACTTRNPVTDVAGMTETTDIPDWCFIEALGYKYSSERILTQEELGILYDKSPIKFVDKVKTPTLVLLGSKDLRVPMTQGLKWHRLLKARGVKTACHVYPDKHSLFKVEVDIDVFVHCMLWILREYNSRNGLQVECSSH